MSTLTIYHTDGRIFSSTQTWRERSTHIGAAAEGAIADAVAEGYAVEFQGQLHVPPEHELGDLPLLRAEFTEEGAE